MDTTEADLGGKGLRLEQLVALNDELEALVRSGIPLERGLASAGRDYRGALGRAIRDLGQRLEAGESLPEAMERSSSGIPAIYRAIIEAGLRSGKLAESLQGMTKIGQATIDARRAIALACFYPLLVVSLAYGLMIFFLVVVIPRFVEALASFRFEETWPVRLMERAGESATIWGPIGPIALVGLLLAWRLAGRSRVLDGSVAGRLPWVGRIVDSYRVANFADLLAHLIDHSVPLDQSVRLAGSAAGGGGAFRESVKQVADRLATGTVGASSDPSALGSFPPLIAWMLGSGSRQGELASGLRHLAASYRRRADRQAERFRVILPGLLIVGIGAVAVLIYGVLLFVPLRSLWDGLATPLN